MKVLVAIDEVSCARKVVEFINRHEWQPDTEFLLVNVVCPITMDMPMASYPNFLESISQASQEDARQFLKSAALAIEAKTSLQPRTDVLVGHPTQIVVSIARDWKADLLILGSHGRNGLERFFYGSVSNDVAAAVHCSVMILRLPTDQTDKPDLQQNKAGEQNAGEQKVPTATKA
jgi:nucleotide-binding universal stress UspA family protein